MPIYLTKPTKKEAEQFWSDGRMPLPFQSECACCFDGTNWYVIADGAIKKYIQDGDYIVKKGKGFYPIRRAIFECHHVLMEQL